MAKDIRQMNITSDEAAELIRDRTSGAFMTVTFVKRTNGVTRVMNCRKGVTQGLVGGKLKFDPQDHNLVNVFDIPKKKHRFISADAIKRIAADGTVYTVVAKL